MYPAPASLTTNANHAHNKVFNIQSRAALAEKLQLVKNAAMLRLDNVNKQRRQLTTPECFPIALAPAAAMKNVLLPSISRFSEAPCVLNRLSLELDTEISLPKIKAIHQKAMNRKQSNPAVSHARGSLHREKTFDGSNFIERSSSQACETLTPPEKSLMGTLHWKNSSGNVVSVGKPVFLTEMEERVSPSKSVFQKSRNHGKHIEVLESTAESLIVDASRLCLAPHSSSHRLSNFWFNATIALAGISKETLEPVLRYFNGPLEEDIPWGHMIAALIEALKDLSDSYQRFLFSWVEEQQELFKNARIISQTDWFNDSLKSGFHNVETLCFVANEVCAFLEEPDVPSHLKVEIIRRDREDLEHMLTLSRAFDIAGPQHLDLRDHSGSMLRSPKKVTQVWTDESHHQPIESVMIDEHLPTDDDSNDEVAEVYYEECVEINVALTTTSKVSIVVAASRKYLKLKVQTQNNVTDAKLAASSASNGGVANSILESRIAYLHTCKALSVAPQSQLFLSETDDVIDLGHYLLGVKGCFALSAGCCKFPALKYLDLQNCAIGVAGCLMLSEALTNCSKLEHLNLGFCIPKTELGNCEELGRAIWNFTKASQPLALAELILSNNNVVGIPIISWGCLLIDCNQHLLKLDLGACRLGSAACHPLSLVIQKLVKLQSLSLRWNEFNGVAISELIEVLGSNQHLFEFDLSWNSCITTCSSAALQDLLFKNTVLSSLDLSFCNIKPKCATIISAGYMANQTLRKLKLEGNPLGPQGAHAFLRISSSEFNEEPRMMSLAGCNLDFIEADVELFDFLHPSGDQMVFDCKDDYDWSCVFLLCAMRCECSQEVFMKATMNGSAWHVPGQLCDQSLFPDEDHSPHEAKALLVRRTMHVTVERRAIFGSILRTGILTLSIAYSKPPNMMSDITFENTIKLISIAIQADGAAKSKKFVKLAEYSMSESLMSSKQAKSMLGKIDDESSKADFIGNMIERVVNKDDLVEEIDSLPKDIAEKLKANLKAILAFDPRNASGRYIFDLEKSGDRTVLRKLMEVNATEKTYRQMLRGGNTSRFGDWENIRNLSLNGTEMRFVATWQPPDKGKVVLDYTCVIRPPKTAVPIDQKCLEEWIEGLSKFISVDFYCKDGPVVHPEQCEKYTSQDLEIIFEGVSWLSNKFYVTCMQLERVLHAFLKAGPVIMTDVVSRMFSRVLDLGKFRAVLLKYFSPENYVIVMIRLGWLNAANPFEVDGYYRLDLAVPEEREVAIFMVDLAVQEPGENWQDEEYDSRPFELPKSWITEVPNKKVLAGRENFFLIHRPQNDTVIGKVMRGSVGELHIPFGMIELNVPLEKLLSPEHSNQISQQH